MATSSGVDMVKETRSEGEEEEEEGRGDEAEYFGRHSQYRNNDR